MAQTSRIKDKKITILATRYEENEIGDRIEITEPLPGGENIWAYYRQASANEFFGAAATQYKVEAIFDINWRNDIDTSMKIVYKGKTYNITRIDDFEGYKGDIRIYAYTLDR
mgnify:FL=1